MDDLWFKLILIFLLILANGFFACSEIAIITAKRTRMKQLMEEGNKAAKLVHQLQGDPDRFFATVQVGLTLLSALAGAVGGVTAVESLKPIIQELPIHPALQRASEAIAVAIVVVLISYLSLVLGELVPKSLAFRYADGIALRVAVPVEWLSRLSSGLIRILTFSSRLILRPFGGSMPFERPFVSEEEVKLILKEARERGIFSHTEQQLIHSVFEFKDISVREVMVSRPKIHAIQVNTSTDQVIQYMEESKFSRYPVYGESMNEILGILYYKDFFGALVKKQPIVLRNLLHPAYYIPETMKVSHLLKELQRRRTQMAIVINEYGSVEGLVTMEDLVEEIVGEIQDEYDIEERPVERLKDGSLAIDASLSVRDLRGDYGLAIPESSEYETLAGFVMSQLQDMPRVGEIIQHGQHRFTIVDMEGRRIVKVKVEKTPHLIAKTPAKT
ncbi:MAG: hemolysin family protein [Nitrospira sp.]|nr:hemolysin family protein [Nitrospira sp.]